MRTLSFTPGWMTLRTLGESRVIKSSYFWFVFVPIVAHAVAGASTMTIPVPFTDGEVFTPSFSLPFRWQFFYYSSLAFAIASLVYATRCPKIVSRFESYAQFEEQGNRADRTIEYLRQHIIPMAMEPWLVQKKIANAKREMSFFMRRVCSDPSSLPEYDESQSNRSWRSKWNATFNNIAIYPHQEAEAFWIVRDLSSGSKPMSRFVCTLFYVIGFAFLVPVLYQNFMYVLHFSVNP